MSDGAIDGRIFVGGLDHDCDEIALDKAFSMFGEITQILIMKDRETNRSRGFGFISFDTQEAADDAIQRMHGVEVMGRCVTVRKAEKQAVVAERGGYRGRRGGFRGGRGGGDSYNSDRYDSRYQPRGRGSYRGGRRFSSDGYSGSFHDSRDSYSSSRRGGYSSSRTSYRDQDNGDRRGDYDSSRQMDYVDVGLSSDYDDVRRGSDRYGTSRKTYASDRYDSHKSISRSYDNGAMPSRDGYGSSRYESDSRARSRSPLTRYVFSRDDSPLAAKSYGREYSPVHRPSLKDYSPVLSSGKLGMSRSYASDSRDLFREYSPPTRGRVASTRDISPEYIPPRSRGRAGSPPSRGRVRDVSPDDFSAVRSRGRAGSPSDRGTYLSSRSTNSSKLSMPSRKADYSSSRSQDYSSRGGRYPMSSKDFQRGAPRGRSGGMDRGSGSRSTFSDHMETRPMRYASARQDSPSPPPSGRVPRDTLIRDLKRTSRRSESPDRRGRRF